MNVSWHKWAYLGVFAMFTGLAACTVTSDDDDDDAAGGSGGSGGSSAGTTSSGGTSAGTTSSGGTTSTGGTTATGGTSAGGSGGTGTAAPVCDPAVEDRPATPNPSCMDLFADSTDPCASCLMQNCCTELQACTATNNETGALDEPCWIGGPNGDLEGELFCFQRQACEIYDANGFYDDTTDRPTAAGACVTPSCGTISLASNDAITCMATNCANSCLPIDAPCDGGGSGTGGTGSGTGGTGSGTGGMGTGGSM